MSNMGSFGRAGISSIVALIFLLIFISQQSTASRLLLQEKTEELVVARGNSGKIHQNMQGDAQHKESAGGVRCVSSSSHQDLRHPRPEDCENEGYRQFEDGDYIYTNSLP